MKKKIMIILLMVVSVYLSACSTVEPESSVTSFLECEAAGGNIGESYPRQCFIGENSFTEEIDALPTIEQLCLDNGGTWLQEPQECENIGKDTCENLGGDFNECASACRNDPEAEICTMQCVLVCEFNEDPQPVIPETCTSWFDGCNNCFVNDGELGGCTRKYCAPEVMQEPKCLEFAEQ